MVLIGTKSFQIAVYSKGNKNSKKLAIVLPGQLDTKDYLHMKSHVAFLSNLGYFALSFDPPGTWESLGDISVYNMTNYNQSVNEIIEYFGNKPTIAVGHSRGGSMAMLAGISNERVKAFISVFSPADYSDYNRYKKESLRDLPENPDKMKKFVLPYSFVEDSKKYNMLLGLRTCTKPKLFIAGTRDDLIKPEYVKEVFNVSASPKEFVEIDSDHDYRKNPEKIEEVNELIGKFVKNNSL